MCNNTVKKYTKIKNSQIYTYIYIYVCMYKKPNIISHGKFAKYLLA